jgi:tetratricopeptide (TPR) repeat protein
MSQTRIAVGIVSEDGFEELQSTLQSVYSLSDNIFILSTEPVADNLGNVNTVRFLSETRNDEAGLRNELIEKIESQNVADWLLLMNTGDRFDEKTLAEFRLFIENDIDRNSLYMMVLHRLHRADGVRHDWDEETIEPRLIPLRKGLRFQSRMRASIVESASKLLIRLNAAPGRFILPSRQRDSLRQKKRANRNLQVIEQLETQLKTQGQTISEEELFVRAEARLVLGDAVRARRDFLRLINETRQSDIRLASYYGVWETSVLSPIPDAELTKILLEGIDRFPVDMQLLTFMGAHLQRLGKHDLAVRTFETAIRYGQTTLDVWHRLRIREIAVMSLALLFRLQGKGLEAIRILETNLKLIADRTEFNRILIDLYVAEQQESQVRDFAATVWGDTELDLIRDVLDGAVKASGGNWFDAAPILESAYLEGCRDVLCLRWYSLTLLSLTRFNEAVTVLEEWNRAEPGNKEAEAFLVAARQPEHFNEIVRQFQKTQLKLLGISKPELLQRNIFKSSPRKSNNLIDQAIREIIRSSGSLNGTKIRISPFNKD